MSLDDREYPNVGELLTRLEKSKIGLFVAFITKEDPHSPVVLPAYESLEKYAENQVPLILVDADDPDNEVLLEKCLVYSVPTFCWIGNAGDENPQIHMRLVGTVLERKLQQEFDEKLEEVLS